MAYVRFELLRAFRNTRYFIFSLGFPLVLYFVIASPNRNVRDFAKTGVSAPLYYMIGLASFGTMVAMISSGGRIATERQAGWTRQLRITPLSVRTYFRAKVLAGYTMAGTSLLLLYAAGAVLGVSLAAGVWLEMTALVLIALLPFAALGIALGHVLNVDSLGAATGGLVSLLALVSGTWFPISGHGFFHDLAQNLPSYWLVQASRVALAGRGWGAHAWIVIGAWTLVLAAFARYAWRRDTQRV